MEGVIWKAQYESSVDKFKIQFDISEDDTPDYQDYIVVTASYDQGETLDTWQDLYSKFSNNVNDMKNDAEKHRAASEIWMNYSFVY